MNENDILRRKFKEKGLLISEFIRAVNSEVGQENYGRVLNRDKKASLDLLLRMAVELGCSAEEIREVLVLRGEKRLAEMVAPTAISGEDQRFLDKLHALKGDQAKLKTVSDLLDLLGR